MRIQLITVQLTSTSAKRVSGSSGHMAWPVHQLRPSQILSSMYRAAGLSLIALDQVNNKRVELKYRKILVGM